MGSRLAVTAALVLVAAFVFSPMGEAFAQRATTKQTQQKVMAKQGRAPSRATVSPVIAQSFAGTFALATLNGRPVRDIELAKSKVTFGPAGEVSVDVGCNGFGTRLTTKAAPNQILGFTQQMSTLIGCSPNQARAEADISQVFAQTANIARAGNSLTFFDTNGINIAQWTATPPPLQIQVAPPRQPVIPQFRPAPINFGDYVLTQLNGAPFANAANPSGAASGQPTFFVRENGQLSGSSGCNQYNSALVQAPDGTTRFGPVVSTKRACLNPATNATETAFFTAMRRAVRVDIGASQVIFVGPLGQTSAQLTRIGRRADITPSLYGKTWLLRRLNGTVIDQTDPPTLVFTGNKVSGATGCGNQFNLDHNRQNGRSRFTNAIMTEMGCGDRRRNDLQIRYVAQLERATFIDVTATTLTLRSADNGTNMIFNAR